MDRSRSRRPSEWKWLHYADPALASMCRSATGSYVPITDWPLCADHAVAPLCRSSTGFNVPVGDTRIGASWQATPELTLRAGISHGQQIVSPESATLNYLAPVTPQDHFTLGATYAMSRDTEVSFMYARAFNSWVDGTGPSTGISVDMSQHWLGASVAFKW